MSREKTWLAIIAGTIAIIVAGFAVREALKPDVSGFPLRHISGTEAAEILNGHLMPGAVEGWSEHAVFVRGSRSDKAKVAAVLEQEDKPKPQVRLRFQIIEADGFTTTDTAIAKVESVLRDLFKYRGYKLAAEAYVQTRKESYAEQTVIGVDGVRYKLEVNTGNVLRREGKASAEMTVVLRDPTGTSLTTSVHVPDGQTVVLGTARTSADRGAIILVVSPEIR